MILYITGSDRGLRNPVGLDLDQVRQARAATIQCSDGSSDNIPTESKIKGVCQFLGTRAKVK